MTEAHSPNQNTRQPASRRIPIWTWVIAGLLMLAAIASFVWFVPPLALAERVSGNYLTLDEIHSTYFHPDGLVVALAGDSASLQVEVTTIPREAFLTGTTGPTWQAARGALPAELTPLSPIYTIRTRGGGQMTAEMSIPNNAEPLEWLDLYAWDSRAAQWRFVPGQLNRAHQTIAFQPMSSPISVMAVHTAPASPTVGLVISPGSPVIDRPVDLALPEGAYIDEVGTLTGTPVDTEASIVIPIVENRRGGITTYVDPVRQSLVSDLVALSASYDGLALDFAAGAGYNGFLAALVEQLHAQNKALHLILRPADLLDTDLAGVGQVADRIWLAPGSNPVDYLDGGSVAEALTDLVGQVERSKLGLLASALTVDVSPTGSTPLGFEEAAAMFGEIQTAEGYLLPDEPLLAVNSELPVHLAGRVESMGFDPALGANYLTYHDDAGELHYVLFGSALSLSRRLEWARRYALGAVAVYGLAHPAAPAGLGAGLDAFLAGQLADIPAPLTLVWRVQRASGEQVAEAAGDLTLLQYVWQADTPGQVTISALVRSGFEESLRGQLTLEVVTTAEPPPENDPSGEATPPPSPTPTGES